MTDLARCKDCAALTLDTDEDIAKHRVWHLDYDKKFRNTRSAAVEARDSLDGLRANIREYSDQLAQMKPPVEPDPINVRDMPTDDELGIDPAADLEDDPRSTYADDDLTGYPETTTALAGSPLSAVSGLSSPGQVTS